MQKVQQTKNNSKKNSSENNLPDISKYEDVEGLSTKRLDIGLWIIEHKQQFKSILKISLILISILTYGYSIYMVGHYLLVGMKIQNQVIVNLTAPPLVEHYYIESLYPQDLAFTELSSSASSDNKNDLMVKVINPNLDYYAAFDYCFSALGKEASCGRSFVLPGQQKYVMALAVDLGGRFQNIQFEAKDIEWRRINKRIIPDWEKFMNERIDFTYSDINYKKADIPVTSDQLDVYLLSFTARNKTAYSYWEAPVNILLLRGNNIVSISNYVLTEFMSNETREVSISWPGDIKSITSVIIETDLDIMNENQYIKVRGGDVVE